MDKKSTRTTNQKQFRIIVDFMKKYPDIAKSNTQRSSDIVQDLWSILQKKLNSFGPPIKEISQWKKVWCDYKSFLRKKLASEKKEESERPNKKIVFTYLEEEVIQLICLRNCEQGINNTKSFKVPESSLKSSESIDNSIAETSTLEDEAVLIDENHDLTSISNSENGYSRNLEAKPRAKRKYQSHFEKEIDWEEELQTVSSGFSYENDHWNKNSKSKRICIIMEKLYHQNKIKNKILQDQLNENIRHNKCMEKLVMEKNKIKAKLIEIELEKLKNSSNNFI